MTKEELEKKRSETSAEFDELTKQRSDIDAKLSQLQGKYQAYTELIDKIADGEPKVHIKGEK